MKQPKPAPERKPEHDPSLPIGQEEGEGTNAIQHEPNPRADPIPDGSPKYIPRTGYSHGND